MKQSTIFARILMLGVILMLVLGACEKQTPGAAEQEAVQQTQEASQPVTEPEVVVTQEVMPPVDQPIDAQTPADKPADGETPTDKPVDGETPADQPADSETPTDQPAVDGDTAVAVDPTPVPDAGGDPATDPQAGGGTGDVPETAVSPVPPVQNDGTYTVSAGENFFRIGLNHGCTVAQMAAVNSAVVPPQYIIYIGQTLVIPDCK